VSASPFGKTSLFQPEVFSGFEASFAATVRLRLDALKEHLRQSGQSTMRLKLEPEIKAVMLEMLVNNFFGAEIAYRELCDVHVPALGRVIDHIVHDTVVNPSGVPWRNWLGISPRQTTAKADYEAFERLTDLVLAARAERRGLWKQFKSEASDDALRSNIKVFLAGALEATTSYAAWALAHLARSPAAQEKVFEEVRDIEDYSPANLEKAKYLDAALNETLRLTPALYFLPRKATSDTWIETADGRTLCIPRGTHILLDVWHANRHEDHWGVAATGYPAEAFAPERWAELVARGRSSKETLHFGFGHGPRVCPGKHLGQLEVALAVGAFVKLFRFRAVHEANPAKAGVSTKPADGALVELDIR
jgi:cytochrome P450